MWKNMVEPDRPLMIMWRMLLAYQITEARLQYYCFSTATMGIRVQLNVTFIRTLPVLRNLNLRSFDRVRVSATLPSSSAFTSTLDSAVVRIPCRLNVMEISQSSKSLVLRASNNFPESQHPQNIALIDVIAKWAGIQMVTWSAIFIVAVMQCHVIVTQEMQFGFTYLNPRWPDELSKPHCTLRKNIGNLSPHFLDKPHPEFCRITDYLSTFFISCNVNYFIFLNHSLTTIWT
jgi:hypothetical protein